MKPASAIAAIVLLTSPCVTARAQDAAAAMRKYDAERTIERFRLQWIERQQATERLSQIMKANETKLVEIAGRAGVPSDHCTDNEISAKSVETLTDENGLYETYNSAISGEQATIERLSKTYNPHDENYDRSMSIFIPLTGATMRLSMYKIAIYSLSKEMAAATSAAHSSCIILRLERAGTAQKGSLSAVEHQIDLANDIILDDNRLHRTTVDMIAALQ